MIGAIELKFCSLDGGVHGELNGVDFVEISKTFATHDAIFFRTVPFDREWYVVQCWLSGGPMPYVVREGLE